MENSVLPGILANRKFNLEIQDEKQQLAYWILVELLAFQFASPVRWIETQDYFFKNGVEMVVEIGPVATLKGMCIVT
jgi:fatty acid synthase subunit alpha